MSIDETVGEYLARARTLVKSKIKNIAMWHSEFDEADAYHMCNSISKQDLNPGYLEEYPNSKHTKNSSTTSNQRRVGMNLLHGRKPHRKR